MTLEFKIKLPERKKIIGSHSPLSGRLFDPLEIGSIIL